MIKCPNCGRDNAVNFNFCLDCGYDLKAYREAFPNGVPSAPPPPPPAVTATNMRTPSMEEMGHGAPPAPPINLPNTFTPAPLPPPPRQATRPQVVLPESSSSAPSNQPPSFPPLPHQASPMPPAPHQQSPLPPLPPLPRTATPHQSSAPMGPAPMPSSPLPPAPMPTPPAAPKNAPGPAAPNGSNGQQTGALSNKDMPPPPAVVGAPAVAPSAPKPAPVAAPSLPPLAAAPAAGSSQCPSCGYANAASVKFCGNCGKRLDGGGAAAAADSGAGQGRTMFMHAADMSTAGKDKLCKLITIDQAGREGMTFTIKSGETLCGRVNGVILFFDDPFVSPTHCKFSFLQSKLKVIDQGSLNGVYLRVKQERRMSDGELIRVGRQLFRYETLEKAAFQVKKIEGDDSRIWGSPNAGAFGRLVQILEDGRTGEIRLLSGERCQLGREIGDIVMPTDGFISGRHCVFTQQGGETVLTDLGSSNGTYVRVRGEADVGHGDFVLVGNQMLRVEII
ncbi:MAG: FHA domain-containing protein [Deltaproteobacteria bacterium]|nr:FHA domain-containing protein [Deltaproteobacteria bacterium]